MSHSPGPRSLGSQAIPRVCCMPICTGEAGPWATALEGERGPRELPFLASATELSPGRESSRLSWGEFHVNFQSNSMFEVKLILFLINHNNWVCRIKKAIFILLLLLTESLQF